MGLNQFAKISPVVNSYGVLLEKDESGIYSRTSGIVLKENETGICIDDNSILVMFQGNPVKLTGGIYNDRKSALDYVNNNDNGQYNGQLVVIKDEPYNLYVIIDKQLYNVIENATKTIVVKMPANATDNIFNIIENSVMQDNDYSKEYLINNIDVKFTGNSYTFFDKDYNKPKYPVIHIEGSNEGSIDINITDNFNNSTTRFIVNDTFKGKLNISMKVLESNEYDIQYRGNKIVSYNGDNIILIITYTVLN